MVVFQVWTILSGVLFLLFAQWTRRFSKSIFLLKNQSIKNVEQFFGGWPKISIMIPACNEASTIEAAAHSLLQVDYPNLELVFIDDRSTDETGRIIDRLALRDQRIKAIHIKELPQGWLGKVHALSEGMSLTQSDWVLLTDADVHFSPTALKKAIAYCLHHRIDFLTATPDLQTKSLALQAMMSQLYHQASLFFDPKRLNDPKSKVCYGQGAFLLFKRQIYEHSQKFEWLKMEVIDDTGLALLMRRAGARMGAVSGLDEVRLEWYPSLRSMIKGLEKNGFAFFSYSPILLFAFLTFVWTIFFGYAVSPFLSFYGIYGIFTGLCLVMYMTEVYLQLKLLMKIRVLSVLLLPVSFALLPLIFVRAATLTLWKKGVSWRGTFYPLSELKARQRMKLANLVFTDPIDSSSPQTSGVSYSKSQ